MPITQLREKQLITETRDPTKTSYTGSSQMTCWTPEDDLIRWEENGSMTSTSQSSEARTLSRPLATPKESMRVGCWNVRTTFRVGKTAQIVRETPKGKHRRGRTRET